MAQRAAKRGAGTGPGWPNSTRDLAAAGQPDRGGGGDSDFQCQRLWQQSPLLPVAFELRSTGWSNQCNAEFGGGDNQPIGLCLLGSGSQSIWISYQCCCHSHGPGG